ncbi:helix-turn-helix domain-containing protein [Vibrio breoganii]
MEINYDALKKDNRFGGKQTKERQEAAIKLLEDGFTKTSVCKALNITANTLRKLLNSDFGE